MTKQHFLTLGPAIPVVPVGDFSRLRLTRDQWAEVWTIVGPSAERNLARGRHGPMELWQVICAAYLEGLSHGSSIERERHE